jgi:hypothetical protein
MALSILPTGRTHTGHPGPWISRSLCRQQILQAIAGYAVGVTAAKFHESVSVARDACIRNGGGDAANQRGVTEFLHVFHGDASCPGAGP